MALNITAPFGRGGAFPIDEDLVKSKAEMLAVNDNVMPEVYLTLCKDDGQIYLYNKANPIDSQTGRYRLLKSSGGLPAGGTTGQALTKKSDDDEDVNWTDITVELTQAEYDALTPEQKNNGAVFFITDGQGGGGDIPIATPTTLGGVKVGAGLQVQSDGTLSADGSGGGAVPDGGTLGQALVKKSNANQDLEWKAIGVQTLNDNVSSDGKWTWKFYDDRTFELWYMAWGIEHTIDTPVGSLFRGDEINLTWPTEFNPRNKSITYHYVGFWFQVPNKLVWPVNNSVFHMGVSFIPLSIEALSPANNCIIRAYIKGKLAE